MYKFFCIAVLFMLSLPSIYSQERDLDSLIDLDVTLKEISNSSPAKLDILIQADKYIIVEGTIASITEFERSEDQLILDIHLINGEWIGVERVEVYKCIVSISGDSWMDRFPARRPRVIEEKHILPNDRILVVGKVSEYILENSELTAVLDAEYIRKIQ